MEKAIIYAAREELTRPQLLTSYMGLYRLTIIVKDPA